ncbi:MAG: hypothetical protein KKG00_09450 [Bacteroidetes bacterium]|nr:hypothetical protein [Bacteroidota bacterium]
MVQDKLLIPRPQLPGWLRQTGLHNLVVFIFPGFGHNGAEVPESGERI